MLSATVTGSLSRTGSATHSHCVLPTATALAVVAAALPLLARDWQPATATQCQWPTATGQRPLSVSVPACQCPASHSSATASASGSDESGNFKFEGLLDALKRGSLDALAR